MQSVANMEDVLEVCHRARDAKRPLICLDEASRQLVAQTRPSIPMKRGRTKRTDAEYRRCGTASVFMVNAPLEGKRHVRVRESRKRTDFAHVIRELCDDLYPEAEKIVLVMDNLNTHNEGQPLRHLCRRRSTAVSAKAGDSLHAETWELAEIELSVLSRQCMSDYFDSREKLTATIAQWEQDRNEKAVGIDWQFTTDDARIRLRKLYPSF